jgi:hypothetical protein
MLSSCAKLLQWCWYCIFFSTQVPLTYSVSQLLASHEYLSSNSHPRIAQIHVDTPRLENWLLSCSQLVPNYFNDGGILAYALHRYPTHIRCADYCHHRCICQAIGTEKSLRLRCIQLGSRFDCLYALNLFANASMMLVLCILLCMYHTHILSPNCSHRMCICQAIVIQKSLKLTFIHPGSRFDCFHTLNLCQTASRI